MDTQAVHQVQANKVRKWKLEEEQNLERKMRLSESVPDQFDE